MGPTYKCSICDRTFSDQSYLEKHWVTHRQVQASQPSKRFQCLYCPYSSDYKSLLDDHVRIHTGERPFSCQYCGRKFRCKDALKKHEARESGVKAYACPHCDMMFATVDGRGKHVRGVHLKERPFKCPYLDCNKTYASSCDLDRHVNSHKGTRKYKCMLCSKAYMNNTSLKNHMHSRHVDDPKRRYPCQICGKVFRLNESLSMHYKQVHDPEYKAKREIKRIENAQKRGLKRRGRPRKNKDPASLPMLPEGEQPAKPVIPQIAKKEDGETSEESNDEGDMQTKAQNSDSDLSSDHEFYEDAQT